MGVVPCQSIAICQVARLPGVQMMRQGCHAWLGYAKITRWLQMSPLRSIYNLPNWPWGLEGRPRTYLEHTRRFGPLQMTLEHFELTMTLLTNTISIWTVMEASGRVCTCLAWACVNSRLTQCLVHTWCYMCCAWTSMGDRLVGVLNGWSPDHMHVCPHKNNIGRCFTHIFLWFVYLSLCR